MSGGDREDPLKDAELLRREAREQARVLLWLRTNRQAAETKRITAMEFCRRVIGEEGLGLADFAVGARQRIAISRAREEALGAADRVLIAPAPQPASEVYLPPFRESVDAIIGAESRAGRGDDDSNDPRTTFKDRLLDAFDAEKLVGEGILHLPGLVTPKECCQILRHLSRHKPEKRPIYLRESTGNGRNGAYENIKSPHALLVDLGKALSDMLQETMGVSSGARPILLQYSNRGVNWAHQDQNDFPYQALLLLSRPGVDFSGGELYVVDSSAATRETTRPVRFRGMGDVVVFAANGLSGCNWYHGMKEVRPGSRGERACHRLAVGLLQFDWKQRKKGKKRHPSS